MRIAWGIARLVAALVGIAALLARFAYGLSFGSFVAENFFWYFTIQTAFAAVAFWVVGGVLALVRTRDPGWLVGSRLLITCYQVISGVVYASIVAGAAATDYHFEVPVSDRILHYWLPAYAVLDWLLAPGRGRVAWRRLFLALVFPAIWGAATVWRGAVIGWYPYFFLDPGQVGSLWGTIAYLVAVAAAIVGLTGVLIALSRVLPRPLRRAAAGRTVFRVEAVPAGPEVDGRYPDEAAPVTATAGQRGSPSPPAAHPNHRRWTVASPDLRR